MLVDYCVCVCARARARARALHLLGVLRNPVTWTSSTPSVRIVKYRNLQWPRLEAGKEAEKECVQNVFVETSVERPFGTPIRRLD
jgi:hypothetical protein